MKYRIPQSGAAKLLAMSVATFVVLSCVTSCLNSRPTDKGVSGIEISPEFAVPAELSGDEPLRAKDGEYSLGPWRTKVGVFELKTVVSGGKKTDEFFALDGKRLKIATEPTPKRVVDAVEKAESAANQRSFMDLLISAFDQPAYASCSRCKAVKFVADYERRRVYGFCRGGGVCSSHSF